MVGKISAAMVVASLKETVAEVDRHRDALAAARAERDELIREALEVIPMLRMVKITGLSRQQLYTIKTGKGQHE